MFDIEKGRKSKVTRGMVRDLCAFYETDRALVERLVTLARATYMDDWTDSYAGAVDKDDWLYQNREDRAAKLMFHDSVFIPSLIQPASYVDMMERTTKATVDKLDYEQAKQFRMNRQERWIASRRPMTCLIGEAAFSLKLGDGVDEDVRSHVLKLARLPFAEIRVIPFAAGRYDLLGWEVNLLEFGSGEEPVIRARTARGGGFVSATSRRGRFFREAFPLATEVSVPVKEYLT
ncbi:hypothetical protein Snas_4317 [Stackebrandtia nassauensis DSM 44728]|uniref:DUF5753 domain-containing protein n=1 Tax=Stackebrandtia nassauensis (strain DSM 44728 / CIP 108903 / NRRL B-16338 / NBRC 102104 / LLR-40K-21) TaxID=446470 RepID=D3Q3P7_STANL|nr:hypothetical protein Snas_4317 [Stackebrandtia nassauensis DSM 44728]